MACADQSIKDTGIFGPKSHYPTRFNANLHVYVLLVDSFAALYVYSACLSPTQK